MGRHLRKFIVKMEPWTIEQYIDSMTTTTKRAQYQRYYDQYILDGKIPSYITPFTKVEKMNASKYKAPRMIQGRHMCFNLHYGRFIKPMEREVTKYGSRSGHFGKGNYTQIAKKIEILSKKYSYYTECDHSNFDAHVTKEQLHMTHQFYRKCYPNYQSELTKLSRRTVNNSCFARNGDKYKTKASRMSGDVDTGFGNCLINYALLKDVIGRLGLKGEVIVNGDDSIIFTDKAIPTEQFVKLMLEYNMETKCQPSRTNIHEIEFCRTKMVYNSRGMPTMQIDPERLVDVFGMTYTVPRRKYHRFLLETAMCNAYINSNNCLGIFWAKWFNIKIEQYKKNEKKNNKIMEKIMTLGKSELLKMASLSVDEIDTAEITPSMLQAWPKIVDIEQKVRGLSKIVLKKKYKYNLTQAKLIIDHDHKIIMEY